MNERRPPRPRPAGTGGSFPARSGTTSWRRPRANLTGEFVAGHRPSRSAAARRSTRASCRTPEEHRATASAGRPGNGGRPRATADSTWSRPDDQSADDHVRRPTTTTTTTTTTTRRRPPSRRRARPTTGPHVPAAAHRGDAASSGVDRLVGVLAAAGEAPASTSSTTWTVSGAGSSAPRSHASGRDVDAVHVGQVVGRGAARVAASASPSGGIRGLRHGVEASDLASFGVTAGSHPGAGRSKEERADAHADRSRHPRPQGARRRRPARDGHRLRRARRPPGARRRAST